MIYHSGKSNTGPLPLVVRFRDERLRKLCERKRLMVRKLGDASARKLRARLEDLHSVANVGELVTGRPHPLKGDRSGQFALELHGGHRLVFEPTRRPPPESPGGGIDWHAVDDVTIVHVGDYHD